MSCYCNNCDVLSCNTINEFISASTVKLVNYEHNADRIRTDLRTVKHATSVTVCSDAWPVYTYTCNKTKQLIAVYDDDFQTLYL